MRDLQSNLQRSAARGSDRRALPAKTGGRRSSIHHCSTNRAKSRSSAGGLGTRVAIAGSAVSSQRDTTSTPSQRKASGRASPGGLLHAPRGRRQSTVPSSVAPTLHTIHKRPASRTISEEATLEPLPKVGRGRKRQTFCKNGCTRGDGSRKFAQPHCQGMCRACAVQQGIVKKTQNSGKPCAK